MFDDKGVFGLDISFYQGNPNNGQYVNFHEMVEFGVDFVIIKAGQRNYADPAFKYNWKAAKEAGLPRGAYWFLDDERDGKSQAQMLWSLVKDDLPEGPLVVDYEHGSGTQWQRVYDFLFELQRLSGFPDHKLWLYTGYYYWVDNGPVFQYQLEYFKKFPLWLAAYTDDPELVRIPDPWDIMTLWQKGTPAIGNQVGVHSKEVDYNVLNGGLAELAKYFDLTGVPTPEPEPEPNEEEKVKFKVIWPKGASVRPEPRTVGYPISVASAGTILDIVEENINDKDDPTNAGKKWAKDADGHFIAQVYPDGAGTPRVRLEKIEEPQTPSGAKIARAVIYDDQNNIIGELFVK